MKKPHLKIQLFKIKIPISFGPQENVTLLHKAMVDSIPEKLKCKIHSKIIISRIFQNAVLQTNITIFKMISSLIDKNERFIINNN